MPLPILPIVPVIGDGQQVLQASEPIDDVTKAVLVAINRNEAVSGSALIWWGASR